MGGRNVREKREEGGKKRKREKEGGRRQKSKGWKKECIHVEATACMPYSLTHTKETSILDCRLCSYPDEYAWSQMLAINLYKSPDAWTLYSVKRTGFTVTPEPALYKIHSMMLI